MRRVPKKTDSIEVRVPSETKAEFMEACRVNGTSASAALRNFIDRYLRSASRAPLRWKEELQMLWRQSSLRVRALAGILGASVTAALVATSMATPARAASDPLLAAVFDWMDANHDRKISAAEFLSPRSAEPLGAIAVVVDMKTRPGNETPQALVAPLDANHDGSISYPEFSAQVVARTLVSPAIAAADSNHDGKITEGELAAYIAMERTIAGRSDPSGGAALMAHAIIAEHDPKGRGWVSLAALER